MVVFRCPGAAVAALVLTVLVGSFSTTNAYDWDVQTDLDRYVHSDDGFFSWEEITSYDLEGVTIYILNMTSQKYQDENFSSQPIWWHIMGIAIPDQIDYLDFGTLWIAGGNNDDVDIIPPVDEVTNNFVISFANDTKVITGYIKQVPNQPIVFADDPTQSQRYENDVIAWTWRSYLNNPAPNNTVLARMPMTKAAKRGLDTIEQFAKSRVPQSDIQRFAVVGASEESFAGQIKGLSGPDVARGPYFGDHWSTVSNAALTSKRASRGSWTTWSLAATDQRVVVIGSFAFSLLNFEATLMNHFQDMDGAWSFAFEPYYKVNLTQEFFNPKAQGIFDVEDVYRYRERLLTHHILQVSSSGDELFLCEENLFWWDGIPTIYKLLLMLPNAEHYMFPHYSKAYDTALSALLTFLQEGLFPYVWWDMNPTSTGGEIIFHTSPAPVDLFAYRAVTLGNDTRRDFRLASGVPGDVNQHPVRWRQDIPIEDLGNGDYRIAADEVPDEWVGIFIEGQWDGPSGVRLSLSSQVHIIPNTYPHDACTDAASCYGTLV